MKIWSLLFKSYEGFQEGSSRALIQCRAFYVQGSAWLAAQAARPDSHPAPEEQWKDGAH